MSTVPSVLAPRRQARRQTRRQTRRQARRRPRRDDVRRALLAAAGRVFALRGIDAASVDDVAAEAGFTKGAVYSNFASKDALVAALVEDRSAAYLDLGLAAAASVDGELSARARALGDRLERAGEDERNWHLLFVELWQRAVRGDASADGFRRRHVEQHRAIAAAVDEHVVGSGSELSFSSAEAATVIMALANGMAMARLLAPAEVPPGLLGRTLAMLTSAGQAPEASD